jgi:hypothetical protein
MTWHAQQFVTSHSITEHHRASWFSIGTYEIKVLSMITGKGAFYPFRNLNDKKFDQSLLDKNTRIGSAEHL